MRILIAHSYGLEGSGSSIYARNLAHALLSIGHEVAVAGYRHPGDQCAHNALAAAGGHFLAMPDHALAVTYPRSELAGAQLISDLSEHQLDRKHYLATLRLLSHVRSFRPDLIIANHFLIAAGAAVEVAGPLGIPVVVVSHGTDIEYAAERSPLLRQRARTIAAGAAARIALNQRARARAAQVLGLLLSDFHIIPPGI
ncbi:MAG: glycosyltransferase family 4 protein, partial [Myxococcota bacterium]